jgi:hypothetical protein
MASPERFSDGNRSPETPLMLCGIVNGKTNDAR